MTDLVKVAIITAVPSTIAAILGFLNRTKIGAVEEKVDGRLTELLELTRRSSHAAGVLDEKERIG
jgi:hypothetical protein